MPDVPRRTPAELAMRYKLEPTLRDIYVEGAFDRRVIKWFADHIGATDAAVYEIDSVEISASQLVGDGLKDNRQGRVIWLSLFLLTAIGEDTKGVTCIADSDFEVDPNSRKLSPFLLYTDFPGLEAYFFSLRILEKALQVASGLSISCEKLVETALPSLRQMFVYRWTNVELGWGMKWYDPFKKCVVFERGGVRFSESEFVFRYLHKNGRAAQADVFREKAILLDATSVSSVLIRGHDAFDLLAWVVGKVNKKYRDWTHDVVLALAVASTDIEFVLQFPLFQAVRDRLKAPILDT